MDAFKKFALIILWLGLLIGIVVLLVIANADIKNWIASAAISIFLAVLGALLIACMMHVMCDIIDPGNKVLRAIIDIFCWIIGIAAAIYLTILIRPYIDFF